MRSSGGDAARVFRQQGLLPPPGAAPVSLKALAFALVGIFVLGLSALGYIWVTGSTARPTDVALAEFSDVVPLTEDERLVCERKVDAVTQREAETERARRARFPDSPIDTGVEVVRAAAHLACEAAIRPDRLCNRDERNTVVMLITTYAANRDKVLAALTARQAEMRRLAAAREGVASDIRDTMELLELEQRSLARAHAGAVAAVHSLARTGYLAEAQVVPFPGEALSPTVATLFAGAGAPAALPCSPAA